MFFFKFPNLGPEKTLLIFSTFSLAHSLIVLFMIFHWDYPAIAPTLVRFPSLYYIFRMFVTSMMVLYVPTILIPVGGALGVYKPHPAMSMPFTVLNIIDLLISFGYTIAYLPFLLLRVLGNDFDDPVTLNSIIVSVVIFALKILFQVCVYSTVHKAVEEMADMDDGSPFSLDSIHTGINILTCCAEKMYDLDLLAIGLETTRTDDDVENQNVSKPEGESCINFTAISSFSQSGCRHGKRNVSMRITAGWYFRKGDDWFQKNPYLEELLWVQLFGWIDFHAVLYSDSIGSCILISGDTIFPGYILRNRVLMIWHRRGENEAGRIPN